MPQMTSGLYRLTQLPRLYDAFQNLLGAHRSRAWLTHEHVRPGKGNRIIDLGCGPGSMLPYLGDVEYLGIDLNPSHIARARELYGTVARFHCGSFASLSEVGLEKSDIVLCFGLLHHLSDDEVRQLGSLACERLKPGGRLIAVDPAFTPDQNRVARWLAAADSGQAVRAPDAYRRLVMEAFDSVETIVRHDLLRVPYTHCITVAKRTRATR